MIEIGFIKDDDEFMEILPLILRFAKKIDDPLWKQIQEVTQAFSHVGWVTIVGRKDGIVEGYLCGNVYNLSDFMVTQMYSEDHEVTNQIERFMEEHLISNHISRVVCLAVVPSVIEKHGYKVIRYLMEKHLKKEN